MKRIQYLLILAAAILLIFAGNMRPTEALVYRHDVDPAEFLLPEDAYPAVFDIFERGGQATLIAPQWAVTPAHVAQSVPGDGSHTIEIGGDAYAVEAVFLHPDWDQAHFDDIALLKFSEPVSDIEPIPLYRQNDEVGQTADLIGRGDFGNGQTGADGQDGRLRRVTNVVEKIESGSIWFLFDDPESPTVTPLEGVAGPGDSGGPAFLNVDGVPHIIGVASFSLGLGSPAPKPGTYGIWDTYTNIAHNQIWLDETMTAPLSAVSPPAPTEPAPAPQEPTADPPNTGSERPPQEETNLLPAVAAFAVLVFLALAYHFYSRSKSGP